jgi:hemerythrin-like domain-containing protein
MKTPTDVLREEHVLILRALDTLERAADRLDRGIPVPDVWWEELIAWLRGFADATHHAREEKLLFPALARAGVPDEGGPVGTMRAEHVEGRALIAAMAQGAPWERAAAARRYVALLRAHIDKENSVLFPLAEAVLDEPAQQALARQFEAAAVELGPRGSIGQAEAVLEGLAAAQG